MWTGSAAEADAPDGTRLYYSSQGVSPGKVEGLVLPRQFTEKPGGLRFAGSRQASARRRFHHQSGRQIPALQDGDRAASVGDARRRPEAGRDDRAVRGRLAVAPELGAVFALTQDGALRVYSYPDFRPVGTYRLAGVGYAMACDGKAGRLYVAAVDPKALSERPRGRGTGEVQVYDVKELLRK